jgi:phytoene dehydrogenase-like protein
MSNATTTQPKTHAPPRAPRDGSTMWAAIEVLRGARKPMTAREIYAEISERKLAPGLKGKTPEQTVAAQLAVHAKRGLYVERAEPGKFRLKRDA